MKIALVAPLTFPINKKFAGGVESFVYFLAKELASGDNEVTIFATAGSDVPGVTIQEVAPHGVGEDNDGTVKYATFSALANSAYTYKLMEDLNKISYDFDIFHFNSYNFLSLAMQHESLAKKSISTLHLPADSSFVVHSKLIIGSAMERRNLVAISDSQAQKFGDLSVKAVIHNGIDLTAFSFQPKPSEQIGWLGRISPEKGLDLALKMAGSEKWKFNFAGKIQYQKYFDDMIKPLMGDNSSYLGEIFGKDKDKFYGNCQVFLAPIQWDEPFGLTIIEAMACGTPVVAFNRGAMPELIVDGVTGYLVEPGDNDGFVQAVEKARLLDRKKCREHIERNFSIKKMVSEYLKLYQKIINQNAKN